MKKILLLLMLLVFLLAGCGLEENCDVNPNSEYCVNSVKISDLKEEAEGLGIDVEEDLELSGSQEDQINELENAISEVYQEDIDKLSEEAGELDLNPKEIISKQDDESMQVVALENAISDEKERLEEEKNKQEEDKKVEEEKKAEEKAKQELATTEDSSSSSNAISGNYTVVTSSACSTSGSRQANAKVDIGFDSSSINREYWAYTNEYAQLAYVTADELILQSDSEPQTSNDRYCNDEAKVPGVESSTLDEGHIIADSLGGTSNAYNITPQDSDLNRYGEQADMEEQIRSALENGQSVTNFYAEISYSDTTTQTPSHYYYSYEIDGVFYETSFDNVVSESTAEPVEEAPAEETPPPVTSGASEPQFETCTERSENGYNTPIYEGSAEYEWYDDRDADGVVCE